MSDDETKTPVPPKTSVPVTDPSSKKLLDDARSVYDRNLSRGVADEGASSQGKTLTEKVDQMLARREPVGAHQRALREKAGEYRARKWVIDTYVPGEYGVGRTEPREIGPRRGVLGPPVLDLLFDLPERFLVIEAKFDQARLNRSGKKIQFSPGWFRDRIIEIYRTDPKLAERLWKAWREDRIDAVHFTAPFDADTPLQAKNAKYVTPEWRKYMQRLIRTGKDSPPWATPPQKKTSPVQKAARAKPPKDPKTKAVAKKAANKKTAAEPKKPNQQKTKEHKRQKQADTKKKGREKEVAPKNAVGEKRKQPPETTSFDKTGPDTTRSPKVAQPENPDLISQRLTAPTNRAVPLRQKILALGRTPVGRLAIKFGRIGRLPIRIGSSFVGGFVIGSLISWVEGREQRRKIKASLERMMPVLQKATAEAVQNAESRMRAHPGFQFWVYIHVDCVYSTGDNEKFQYLHLVVPVGQDKQLWVSAYEDRVEEEPYPVGFPSSVAIRHFKPFTISAMETREDSGNVVGLTFHIPILGSDSRVTPVDEPAPTAGGSGVHLFPAEYYLTDDNPDVRNISNAEADGAWANAQGIPLRKILDGSHEPDRWPIKYRHGFIYGYIAYGAKYGHAIPAVETRSDASFEQFGRELALADRYAHELFTDYEIKLYRQAAERKLPRARKFFEPLTPFTQQFPDRGIGPEYAPAKSEVEEDEEWLHRLRDAREGLTSPKSFCHTSHHRGT